MHEFKIFITPEDIINKLSDEDRERFNHCLFKDVEMGCDGSVTISCLLYNGSYTEHQYRQKIVDNHPLRVR